MPAPIPHRNRKDAHCSSFVLDAAVQCEGKQRFASRDEVERVQRYRKRKKQPYRCPHCGGWHFAGTTARGTMRKRASK